MAYVGKWKRSVVLFWSVAVGIAELPYGFYRLAVSLAVGTRLLGRDWSILLK